MPSRINRIGQRYGKLTVLKEGLLHKGHFSWVCQCDCGNVCSIVAGNLASGHTQSCGHCEKYTFLDEDTVKCELPNGDFFLFSSQDYEAVIKHKWSIEDSGYPHTTIDGLHIRLHKYLMGFESDIDHINGMRNDNRRSNLRQVTNQQNSWNTKKARHNTSGYKGVSYDKRRGKYSASIMKDGKNHFLGYYDSPIDAAIAYDDAAFEYFGEYARPNFKEGGNSNEKSQEVLELGNADTERRRNAITGKSA